MSPKSRSRRTRQTGHRRTKKQPHNRKWLLGVLVLLLIGAAFVSYEVFLKEDFEPIVTGAPSAQIARTTLDHGDVQLNKFVTSEFEIRNVGDQQLMILNQPHVQVIEGCCPPSLDISDMELNPGETAKISMDYTMHEGMGGPHEFQIRVMTNDPNQPEIILTAFSNWVS